MSVERDAQVVVGQPAGRAVEPRLALRLGRRDSSVDPARAVIEGLRLWVYDVGLACCAVELVAGVASATTAAAGLVDSDDGPACADVLVVSGTVSAKVAPSLRRLYDELPEPRYVLSFGACANTGGPYWDSYCVTAGVDRLFPVDVYVPGCPPRPQALLAGLIRLREIVSSGAPG